MLAFLENAVGDALQQLDVVGEGADVALGDLVGRDVEVLVAQRREGASIVSISALRAM